MCSSGLIIDSGSSCPFWVPADGLIRMSANVRWWDRSAASPAGIDCKDHTAAPGEAALGYHQRALGLDRHRHRHRQGSLPDRRLWHERQNCFSSQDQAACAGDTFRGLASCVIGMEGMPQRTPCKPCPASARWPENFPTTLNRSGSAHCDVILRLRYQSKRQLGVRSCTG
jgi:hypothetical protein